MITDFLWNELEDIDIENMWFQQDGAPYHTATETLDLLKDKFGNRRISRNGDVNWSPRSCDFNSFGLVPLGLFEGKVYEHVYFIFQ